MKKSERIAVLLSISFIISIGSILKINEYRNQHPPEVGALYAPNHLSPDLIFIEEKEFIVFAYCPCKICCRDHADNITASGYEVQEGDKLISAQKQYPFGTIMDIPGYGIAEVKDRGVILKNHLDVFFWNHEDALQWGIQVLIVKVYRRK